MKAKQSQNKDQLLPSFDLSRRDGIFFIIGIAILVIGFTLMTFGPWDNPLSRTVSPMVLLVAYLIVFPIAILGTKTFRLGSKTDNEPPATTKVD